MFSVSDVVALLGIAVAWLGAVLGLAILAWARNQYGLRKSRTIGAILLDTSIGWYLLILVLGLVPFVRIVNPAWPPATALRFVNIGAYVAAVWFAVARLLVWLLKGDAGQAGRDGGGIP